MFGSLRGDPVFTGVVQLTGMIDDVFTGYRIPCQSPILLFQPDHQLGRITLYDYISSEDDGILFADSFYGILVLRFSGTFRWTLALSAGALCRLWRYGTWSHLHWWQSSGFCRSQ